MFSYIAPGAKQYRANLHSHTNLSDGALTPEQMVQAYQEKGYSILAITDHEAHYDHTALSTDDFLMLTGYEAYIRPSPTCEFDLFKPEIHLNLLAKDPHNTAIIGWDPNFCKYMPLEVAEHQREHKGDLGPRKYSREYIQRFIDTARPSGSSSTAAPSWARAFTTRTAAPSPTRSWTCRPSASTSISRSTRPMEKPPIPGRSGGQSLRNSLEKIIQNRINTNKTTKQKG